MQTMARGKVLRVGKVRHLLAGKVPHLSINGTAVGRVQLQARAADSHPAAGNCDIGVIAALRVQQSSGDACFAGQTITNEHETHASHSLPAADEGLTNERKRHHPASHMMRGVWAGRCGATLRF